MMGALPILEFVILSSAIAAVMQLLKRVKKVRESRLLPMVPLVLGAPAGFFAFALGGPVLNVALGLLAGSFSAHAYKILKTLIEERVNNGAGDGIIN